MITVLRLNHRIDRDKRITTHVGLVARAFGADELIIDTKDESIVQSIQSVSERFGGNFKVRTGVKPKNIVKKWEGVIVHLTMYGQRLDEAVEAIDIDKPLLIIIGSEKVPPWCYNLADFNISIGNQPHSEIAALALFLDRLHKGSWQQKDFHGKITIHPSKNGKHVESKERDL
jgi:tRNA (cytidine56-2'-O)-methyltransferase